ncbi:MAG TPA: ATP-binding protein [Gaiellaceae bacterium]|jgi:PAS domain S-box-containing protein|nr:ATP-binding protein [Gaiellaceae bacterium]
MTFLDVRLPARFALPLRPNRFQLRLLLFLIAWAFVSMHWLSWQALPFQAVIATAVLWQALRRERLLEALEREREQHVAIGEQLHVAEERYRSLVETLPLATYVDRPNQVTGAAWVSHQIEKITSYAAEEWVADQDLLSKVLHPDDRERVLAAMEKAKATCGEIDHEYRLVRRDGRIVWLHDSAITVVEGEHHFARGFIVDVTARRDAELELETQNEQLRELDRLKDEFIALVSHELRTPLTSIRGYLELLGENRNLTPEQTHFLDTIDRNAVRLQRVVGDLLFCAQLEAGKLILEQGEVDPMELALDAVDAALPAATSAGVELVTDLDKLPTIAGDRARLAQVLDNFVSNAIKFTPTGGCVTVSTRLRDGEIEIGVSDTGMGIPKDELPNLFQRFFRTERATSKAIPGTGLGLAIAKAIVEGHHGRVAVESTDGDGTTFRIFLPV